jgi:hypothetical protein
MGFPGSSTSPLRQCSGHRKRKAAEAGDGPRGAIAAPLEGALAWVLTLPAAMMLSGCLYLVFSRLF